MEKILNKRTTRGKKKFLVRWKGYMAEKVPGKMEGLYGGRRYLGK